MPLRSEPHSLKRIQVFLLIFNLCDNTFFIFVNLSAMINGGIIRYFLNGAYNYILISTIRLLLVIRIPLTLRIIFVILVLRNPELKIPNLLNKKKFTWSRTRANKILVYYPSSQSNRFIHRMLKNESHFGHSP